MPKRRNWRSPATNRTAVLPPAGAAVCSCVTVNLLGKVRKTYVSVVAGGRRYEIRRLAASLMRSSVAVSEMRTWFAPAGP